MKYYVALLLALATTIICPRTSVAVMLDRFSFNDPGASITDLQTHQVIRQFTDATIFGGNRTVIVQNAAPNTKTMAQYMTGLPLPVNPVPTNYLRFFKDGGGAGSVSMVYDGDDFAGDINYNALKYIADYSWTPVVTVSILTS